MINENCDPATTEEIKVEKEKLEEECILQKEMDDLGLRGHDRVGYALLKAMSKGMGIE